MNSGVSPTKESLEAWFNAGVTCVGMGSKLIAKDQNGQFDYQKIETLVRDSLAIIQNVKTNQN